MKKITFYLSLITITLIAGFACQSTANPPTSNQPVASASPVNDPNSVSFRIQEVNRQKVKEGDEVTWLATHESQSGAARFKIRLILKKAIGDPPIAFSKGALLREDSSQSTEFLRQVAKALEAKGKGKVKPKTDLLDFTVAILGENLSRGAGSDRIAGGFTSTPPGNWVTTKAFVADGEGEFYLNLNPQEGVGEISMKDPEYGDIVLKELERIF